MLFYGRAFWIVTSRFGNGFPATFTWIPAADVQTRDQAGPQWFGPSKQVTFNGIDLNPNDVVQFLSPIQGLLSMGARSIRTNINLDTSAERFAKNQTPAGVLRQVDGEPLSAEELSELAAGFAEARNNNAIAALNQYVQWKESYMDPSKLQLTEARTYQALEMARIANIPPYLVGAPSGSGMTYQNAQQARQDLYLFGAKPFIDCIEQTLSMNNITPRGRYIYLDVDSYSLFSPCFGHCPMNLYISSSSLSHGINARTESFMPHSLSQRVQPTLRDVGLKDKSTTYLWLNKAHNSRSIISP